MKTFFLFVVLSCLIAGAADSPNLVSNSGCPCRCIDSAGAVVAQNLVANGSFEDVNICQEFKARCSPAAWLFVSQKEAKGFYSLNRIPGTAGKNYLSLDIARPNNESRQYWETVLLCGLRAGVSYHVRVNLANDEGEIDPGDLGLYFTNRLVFSSDDTLLQPLRFLSLTDAKVKRLKDGWIMAEKDFVADSNFKYLVIGNFSGLPNKQILQKKGIATKAAILIDDLWLTMDKGPICEDYSRMKDSLYAVRKRHDHLPKPDTLIVPPPVIPVVKVDTVVIPNVLFAFNSAELKEQDILDGYEKQLTAAEVKRIVIAGYTDSVGNKLYNRQLSAQRANAVALLLRKRLGVEAAKLSTEGRGISTDFADLEKNRRVELYIYH